MGTGFLFLLIVLFCVPLGLGMLIGYFLGKGKSSDATSRPATRAELAVAWQEGYEAAHAGQPAGEGPRQSAAPEPLQPYRPTPPTPPTAPAPPAPTQPVAATPRPEPVYRVPDVPQRQPQQPQHPSYQGPPPAPVFMPPPLTPQQLALRHEQQQIRNANILLYVAALLMVGTGMLFIGAGLPFVVTVGSLGFVTAAFYGAGLLLHKFSPRLRSSGTAFTGTGLGLYPIFALSAASQIWPGSPWPWLVFSILGSIAFSVAAAILNSRVVAFLTVPFILSMGVAAGSVLRAGMVWSFVFTILLATIISWFAAERPRWMKNIFVQAFVYTHEYIVPATLLAQLFVFTKMSDVQNTVVFAAALLYYITRTVLSASRHKLYYFSAARVLFLLTLWQTLRTLDVPGSTIAIVMSLGLAATIITVLLAQQRYVGLLRRSERSERYAIAWLRSDVGLHGLGLLALAGGTEARLNPNLFGQGDIASLNLPLIIMMVTAVTVILFQQGRGAGNTLWGRGLGSPLWFLAAPFWVTRAAEPNYGGEFFRPEIFWLLGLVGYGIVLLRRRQESLNQLVLAVIGATVAYLALRTHVGVANPTDSGQAMTVVTALWSLALVLWVFAVLKLMRGTRVPAEIAAGVAGTAAEQPTRRQWYHLSERVAGYLGAAGTAFGLWMSLSSPHATALRDTAFQQPMYLSSMIVVVVIVISFGLILLRNMRRSPESNIVHAALWVWAVLGLLLGIRERSFLSTLDPGAAHWFSLVFGLILVAVVWFAGYFTGRLKTESAAIKARWYQIAAVLGLGYALLNGLRVLQADPNVIFAVPLVALLGYFLYLTLQDGRWAATAEQPLTIGDVPGLYRHQIGSAGLLLVMPLFLLLDVPHFHVEFSTGEIYRGLLLTGWLLLGALVLWYGLRHFVGYLPVAAFGFANAAGTGSLTVAMAGESALPAGRFWTDTAAGWIMVGFGAGIVALLLLPLLNQTYQRRWKSAGIWSPILAYVVLGVSALLHTSNGYVWGAVGLLMAAALVLSSYQAKAEATVLRPLAVPVIFLAMLPLADRLQSDVLAGTENLLPIWLIAGFLGGALSYLIGLFCVGGHNGSQAATNTRLAALLIFLLFMVYGWTDTKAALVFAVVLTLVGMLGLGREMRAAGTRRTVWELMLIVAVLGAQRIWSDVPGNHADQRAWFWFIQQWVLALAVLAVITALRHRGRTAHIEVPPPPSHSSGSYAPVIPGLVETVVEPSSRFTTYWITAASFLSVGTFLLFGLENSAFEFFWILAAFAGMIVYGAIGSRTGMLIWGILGIVLTLMIFLQFGSVLLLFPLALALMGVGVWQLIRITSKPSAATAPPTMPPGNPPYDGAGPAQLNQPPYSQGQPGQGHYGQPPAGPPQH